MATAVADGNGTRIRSDTTDVDEGWNEVEKMFTGMDFGEANEAEQPPTNTLIGWLTQFQMQKYHDVLVDNGFDDLHYLSEDIIGEADIRRLGVQSQDDCSTLAAIATMLPSCEPLDEPATVGDWLAAIGLEQYAEVFAARDLTTMKTACALWEKDFEDMGISKLGHRRRLMSSIRELHMMNPFLRGDVKLPDMSDEELMLRMRKLSLSRTLQLSRESSEPTMPATDVRKDFSHVQASMKKRDYVAPALPPRVKVDTNETRGGPDPNDPNFDGSRPQNDRDLDPLNLRSPQHAQEHNVKLLQKMGIEASHHSKMGDAWKHQVTSVLKGNLHYDMEYLGTDLVKKFEGPKTTEEACRKMIGMADRMTKVPKISLWIHGVIIKFVDTKSQSVIRKDELKTVLYIAQDRERPTVFGYIARDPDNNKLCFCHVLRAATKKEANEVVMTLGQAFEIAYQNRKKEKAIEKMAAFEQDIQKKKDAKEAAEAPRQDGSGDPGRVPYSAVIPKRHRRPAPPVPDAPTPATSSTACRTVVADGNSVLREGAPVKIIASPQLLQGRSQITHSMTLRDDGPQWVTSQLPADDPDVPPPIPSHTRPRPSNN